MTYEALVLDVADSYAEVNRPGVNCASCTGEVCTPKNATTRAIVPPGVRVEVDDWVEISYSAGAAIVDGLVLLGIPILGFVAGYLLAPLIGAPPTGSLALGVGASGTEGIGTAPAGFFKSEAGRAVAGLIGLAVGGIVPLVRKQLRPDAGLPSITRTLRRRPRNTRTPPQTPDRSPA